MIKSILKSTGIIIGYLIAQLIGVLAVIVYLMVTNEEWWYNISDTLDANGVMSAEYLSQIGGIIYPSLLIADLLILIPFLIHILRKRSIPIKSVTKHEFTAIFCLGICCNTVVSFIVDHLPDFSSLDAYNSMMSVIINDNIAVTLLVTGILAPVIEEFTFRYAVISFSKQSGTVKAVLMSALLFGVAHMNLVQSTYAFLLGIILGLLYVYKYNLSHSILFHIVVNSSSVIYEYLPDELNWLVYMFIACCCGYCIYSILKYRRCYCEGK